MLKSLFFYVCLVFSIFLVTSVWAWPIPDSGQDTCYDDQGVIECPQPGEPYYGQDANYSINPRSYTKLDEQGNALPDSATEWVMVKDNVTGLIWEVKTDDGGIRDKDDTYTWQGAQDEFITELNSQNFGDHSDWRMPTIKELASLVNLGTINPAIDKDYFPNTKSSFSYWSSTTYAYDEDDDAWRVRFYGGHDSDASSPPLPGYYVRAVRSGQSGLFDDLIIHGDGTVTDPNSGLTWQRATAENQMTWSEALNYCENLNLAGHNDWRLPTREELRSIMNYNSYKPTIDEQVFPDTYSSSYWSSTTYAYKEVYAWLVDFLYGGASTPNNKSSGYYLRAVRGGQEAPPKGEIVGILMNYTNLQPIENGSVSCSGGQATTNSTGQYKIENLTPGNYTLTASAPLYHSKTVENVEVQAGQETTQDFELEKKTTGALVGKVLNVKDLSPVENVQVDLENSQNQYQDFTTTQGEFSFDDVKAGDYTVDIYDPDYWGISKNASIYIDEITNATLTVIPYGIVNDIQSGLFTQSELDQAINNATSELYTQEELNQEVQTAISVKNEVISNKNDYISSLNSTLSNKESTIESLLTKVTNKNATIDEQNQIISSLNSTLTNKEDLIADFNSTINDQNDLITDLNSTVQSLNATLSKYDQPLDVSLGWNLVGALNAESTNVSSIISKIDQSVISVWKWADNNWSVFLPGADDNGTSYAQSKGFGVMESIETGEGFWVNCQ